MSLLSPQLQAFVAVCRLQTVHGAGKSIGITQTGVTQRIRSLESQLGATLFTRSRRGMMPTTEGQALLRYCQAASEMEGETLASIQKAGLSTAIRVSITGPTSIIESRISMQCIPVMKKFPGLSISFLVDDIENRGDDLKSGLAQIAIIPREQVAKEFDSKLLRPEEYVLVGTASWTKRDPDEIVRTERIIDFDATDRMSHSCLKKLKLLHLARTERHFVNNNKALIQMFQAGLGYGVLSTDVAKPFIENGTLTLLCPGQTFLKEFAIAWYPRPVMPGYWRSLIAAIH